MQNTLGYYSERFLNHFTNQMVTKHKCTLPHSPDAEKELFKIAIGDIAKVNVDRDIYGIEIGVLNGDTSAFLLSLHKQLHLIGIDPLIPDSMEASLIGNREVINFNTKIYKERFTFIQEYSYAICKLFVDNLLDFIFIDGDHTYDAVKKDFDMYYSKVKVGGLIFFHDSRMNRGGANFHIGSSKFVDELIDNNKGISLIGEAFSLTCFQKNG